ncbi:MAG TPA: ribonuclease P protein component [Candidatus Bathyarchaeia archaeon]|nr:ribonuclease P protein component [Candidatus Bathyarchaeia archaeon]
MLPKQHRLPAYLIPKVIKQGVRFRSANFTLIVLKAEKDIASCFAFNVAVRFDKRSTRRNRLKRKLREFVRLRVGKIKKGYNVMCQVSKPERRIKLVQINLELEKLLRKAELLEN